MSKLSEHAKKKGGPWWKILQNNDDKTFSIVGPIEDDTYIIKIIIAFQNRGINTNSYTIPIINGNKETIISDVTKDTSYKYTDLASLFKLDKPFNFFLQFLTKDRKTHLSLVVEKNTKHGYQYDINTISLCGEESLKMTPSSGPYPNLATIEYVEKEIKDDTFVCKECLLRAKKDLVSIKDLEFP
ncbi:hypothetical protein ND856_19175 [Leptospira bandrabouensis]|uniref:hypothetical protein n=1 Tax=Leptospira bandrabouensis TaxID=2484903 RepID=UPI00223DFE0E|nr:hypothetical protein [Leptospira bandrabouensis]MCW7460382.1 hypothetical protein [Leptospira bandrabouensis]MCW7479431.1 hypothetical protein [Leptospira bandrabouensis]MCW7487112.1 hypothetical protein [Leptospira bandrabouensis]